MGQRVNTRTIHTIEIDVLDDVLAKIDRNDEVEIVLVGRNGQTLAKKLTYRDLDRLISVAY
jgi:DNA-binding protein Fis